MPGGRLSAADRDAIAAGLAQGRGFAEIARDLDRPTSTVTREVARNGGARGYQAGRAQAATDHRARRRRTAPPAAEETSGASEVRRFVDEFADLMVETGVPRMPARVLTCLYAVDSGSLTAGELVERLRVSPASVSKAIAYLDGLELVRRERDPRTRRERYAVDDDVWLRAWTSSAKQHHLWADAAQRGVALLGPQTRAGARMAAMGEFFGQLADDMSGADVMSGLVASLADDVRTVVAALLVAGKPLPTDHLAVVLDWKPERVDTALRTALQHPEVSDPIAVQQEGAAYTAAVSAQRLTPAQRAALR